MLLYNSWYVTRTSVTPAHTFTVCVPLRYLLHLRRDLQYPSGSDAAHARLLSFWSEGFIRIPNNSYLLNAIMPFLVYGFEPYLAHY